MAEHVRSIHENGFDGWVVSRLSSFILLHARLRALRRCAGLLLMRCVACVLCFHGNAQVTEEMYAWVHKSGAASPASGSSSPGKGKSSHAPLTVAAQP